VSRGALALAKRWLPRILAVVLLYVALQQAGIPNVWRSLTAAHLIPVLISLVLVLPFIVMRAARWRSILSELGIACSLGMASRLYAIGLWVGMITPGQAGDAIKAWYLSRRGESLALSLLSCVLDRLFDVLVLAAIATTALVVYWPNEQRQWLLGIALMLGVLLGLVVLARPDVRGWLLGLPGVRFVWSPLERRLRRLTWGPPLLDSGLSRRSLALALLLTLAGFAVTMTRVYLVFMAVDIVLPLLPFMAVASIMVFASLVSVAGVGSRDIALIALLTPFGYSREQAVAASFLILFLNLTNIIPGLLASIGWPAPVKPAAADG
jgi:uncharacterized membrane protein YbhN (UPF0104 family)